MKKFYLLFLPLLFFFRNNASACEASFIAETSGLTIYLDGSSSTGDIAHWQWFINEDLFSDDGPTTDVTVTNYGTYTICVVIETFSGCLDTFCHEVNVEEINNDCEASFIWETDGFTIFLNGNGSTGDVVHWTWLINGDVFSDSGPETDIIVSDPGEYEICLVIETSSGCVDTFCHGVWVEEESTDCEACFESVVEDLTIFLYGNCSNPPDQIVSWQWFINGDLFSDDGPEVHVTVDQPGEFEICLVIETISGCVDTFCHGVWVEEETSDCEACFESEVENLTIFLNGNCSDPNDQIVSWYWFIDGDLFSDDGPEVSIPVSPGEYEICLVIETASGCVDLFCDDILVEEQTDDCEACFEFETDGMSIVLSGHCSVPLDQIISWQWFIDGDLFSDSGPEVNVTVDHPGEFEICLVIETTAGCVDTFCHGVIIQQFGGDFDMKTSVANDGNSVTIILTAPEDCNVAINVADMSGKQVFNSSSFIQKGTSEHVIETGRFFSAGIYFITVDFDGQSMFSQKAGIMR